MWRTCSRRPASSSHRSSNLAQGRPVSASFTAPDTELRFAVDGFSISGPAVAPGSYVMTPSYSAPNTIWGTKGSPNAEDWLEVDLGSARRFDGVKLYFYSNKEFGIGPPQGPAVEGNTYREPSRYTVQYHDGAGWVDVPAQVARPAIPRANYNHATFAPVTARRLRVLMAPQPGYGIGVKELQVFDSGSVTSVPGTVGGTVPPTLSLALGPPASFGAFTPGVAREYSASTTANVISTAGDATLSVSDPSSNATGHLVNGSFSLRQPLRVAGRPLPAVIQTWTGPVSNAAVMLAFQQAIGAGDPLRTGTYSKSLTFTLSTTSP